MQEWVLWCGCRLPSAAIVAHPETSRTREERCGVCGAVLPPYVRAHRIRRDALAPRQPLRATP